MKYNTSTTMGELLEIVGQKRASEIVKNETRRKILIVQAVMRNREPVYHVLLKDPIAGKLIIKTDHVLYLEHIGKNNKRRDWFTKSEVDSMRRIMPGFDKYYEIRRAGYDNE